MKIRKSAASHSDKVEIQMTPMIDIVFQLLIFFLMSFKIITQEGDFNIKMPLAAPSQGPTEEPFPPVRVRLTADETGRLSGILYESRPLRGFNELNTEIMKTVGANTGPTSLAANMEVEIDADYNLRYENVVSAITALSGHVDPSGHIVKLVEKIKFSPPKPPE